MRPADATEVVDAMTTGDAMGTDWDAVLVAGAEEWDELITNGQVIPMGHLSVGTPWKRGTPWTSVLW
jgi:hypothetical protein